MGYPGMAQQPADEKVAAPAQATDPEVFILNNGDRLSGVLDRFEENAVVVKTDKLGEVKIPWENVHFVQSKRVLYFRLENGNVLTAQAGGVEDNKQVLHTAVAGKMLVPRETMLAVGLTEEGVNPDFLRTQKELKEAKDALYKATTVSELWSGYIDVSFNGNEGNKNDRTLIGIGHVERKTDADMFTAHIDIGYSQAKRERTKNQIQGYLKQTLDITERLYVFGQLSGEWDEINNIELRFRAELGFGVHVLKVGDWEVFAGDKITLDCELGGQITSTDYDNQTDTQTGGTVTRVIYRHIFPNEWKLEITGEYYQSFKEPRTDAGKYSDYSLKGRIGLTIPISDYLSFSGAIWDEYNNITANNTIKRNDFYWTLGLRVTL
jgi:putative salt-induced outer membrane protein YdiY